MSKTKTDQENSEAHDLGLTSKGHIWDSIIKKI